MLDLLRCRLRFASTAEVGPDVGSRQAAEEPGDAGPQIELAFGERDEDTFTLVRALEGGLGGLQRRGVVVGIVFGAPFGHRKKERRVAVEAELGQRVALGVESSCDFFSGRASLRATAAFEAHRQLLERDVQVLHSRDALGAQDLGVGTVGDCRAAVRDASAYRVEVRFGALYGRATAATPLALRDERVPFVEQRDDDRIRFRQIAGTRRNEQPLDLTVVDFGTRMQLFLECIGSIRQALQPIDQLVAAGETGLTARDARRALAQVGGGLGRATASKLSDDHRAADDLGSRVGIGQRTGELEREAADLGGSGNGRPEWGAEASQGLDDAIGRLAPEPGHHREHRVEDENGQRRMQAAHLQEAAPIEFGNSGHHPV